MLLHAQTTLDLCLPSLRDAYANHAYTPSALIKALLTHLQSCEDNPIWIYRLSETALMQRTAALESLPASVRQQLPLYGIPFAIKDNIDVAGLPTTAGCPDYAYVPTQTATAVQRLLDAGAILIGKTNLDQFATGLVGTRSPYGACRNPFDGRYISGGSSSGSAVSVALGLVSFSLGTDTAGSGRVPAAFNNIVGLKPTRGLISTAGVVPACRSLDCVSIFAQTVDDAVDVLEVLDAFDPKDAWSRPVRPARMDLPQSGFRFGIPQGEQLEFFGDLQYAARFADGIGQFTACGGQCVEIDYTPFLAVQALLYQGPWVAERWAQLEAFAEAHPDAMHPVVRAVIAAAKNYSATDAFRAQYQLAELRRQTAAIWSQIDVLLVPGAPTLPSIDAVNAQPIEQNSALGYYTNFVNLLDLAAITVPGGFCTRGLPFGLTLIGPADSDRSLAALAARLHYAGQTQRGMGLGPVPVPKPLRDSSAANEHRLAVVGAHLSGMALNHQLIDCGARFVRATQTAPKYRLYALETTPPKPGLVKEIGSSPSNHTASIALEIWSLTPTAFASFVAQIPAPLGIGTIELIDGQSVQGFLCESHAVVDAKEITSFGGWRAYIQSTRTTPNEMNHLTKER